MALNTWWLYVTVVFLIAGTPGPNMLHVMVQSIQHGTGRALASMAGLMSAVLLCLLASAAGLGALLKASPLLYDIIRYVGVAYLVWLGIKAWRAPVASAEDGEATPQRSLRALYLTGLGTGLSNPKLIVFAAALFPQFLDRVHCVGRADQTSGAAPSEKEPWKIHMNVAPVLRPHHHLAALPPDGIVRGQLLIVP